MSGFVALPVAIPSLSSKSKGGDEGAAVHHYLFFKEHTAKRMSDELPQKRTLFVLNPPLDAERALTDVFTEAVGPVDKVVNTTMPGQRASDKPVPVAYVVFKKANSLKAALQLDASVARSLPERSAEAFGVEKWQVEYEAARPAASVLQAKIDADLSVFDDERAREKATRLAMDGKEDEEESGSDHNF